MSLVKEMQELEAETFEIQEIDVSNEIELAAVSCTSCSSCSCASTTSCSCSTSSCCGCTSCSTASTS
ncbi:hypothetical protein EII35_14680 [Arachnia propionica]|uniref:Thiazolylpeptide-type bacteriocin n=1 Tax=Arachnia propionica TaxID=1750 RepID=A0A3P1WN59_9ACTN|nr:hypothetical protein EII35_14680 [Arachnia propionica]